MNNFKSYEKKIKTSYSELDAKTEDGWAILRYKREKINGYTDKKYINHFFTKHIVDLQKKALDIIDFGGGDGVLLDIIGKQLDAKGIKANLLNVDNNSKSLLLCNKRFPKIKTKLQDILTVNNFNKADVVISRFSFQYFSKANQIKLMRIINKTLKSGGILIAEWPYGNDEKIFHEIITNIKSIISGEEVSNLKKSIYNFLPNNFTDLLKESSYVGVKKELGGVFMHSTKSWDNRFKINKDQLKKLDFLYSKYFSKTRNLFFKQNNIIYLKSHVCFAHAFKK